ncbi:GFA family protein [Sphingomonas sp. S2-65]|uniref:GFA family protein n=1 Tax=Sphingomonas sp. S2-65 TaxID=2903960 RepID=UPI001F3343AA|nr:GFA family protein [Sphingomonas sp. S2-65]UYY58782.1 GFA family protein [Sphingomonas sp. S2-65]
MKGGCFCGAVRYRLTSTPYDTGWCHCRICQKISGAPALVFTTVPLADYVVEQGGDAIGRVKTTPSSERSFCTRCGTPLTIHVAFQADEVGVTATSLDDPAQVTPDFHIFYAARQPWAEAGDDLPRNDGFRPQAGETE